MSDAKDTAAIIKRICIETFGFADLRDDEDFFDRGASSLTIVELQLQIEKELGWEVATSELMLNSSMAGWSRVYSAAARKLAAAES